MPSYKTKAAVVLFIMLAVNTVFIAYYSRWEIHNVLGFFLGNNSTDKTLQPLFNHLQRKKELEEHLARRTVKVEEVDCRRLMEGDRAEQRRARNLQPLLTALPNDSHIAQEAASDCTNFLLTRGFITDPLTELERHFPIAFSILAFKQASQVVDLLRAIYRPQNYYCLHADQKADPDFHQAVRAVADCLPNVFMASRTIKVTWRKFTVLEPEIVCLGDLWPKKAWKYFINLTGQEFPLKTNYEMVRILSALMGANDIVGIIPTDRTISRWKKALPAPHNITLYKGSIHVLLSRAFVDYVLHNQVATDFLTWCKNTSVPDEHYFNSLNHNRHLKAPGGYKGKVTQDSRYRTEIKPHLARYKNWGYGEPCPGKKFVHHICILSVLDLPMLNGRKELFANKFYADYSHWALRCMAQTLHNRTLDQTLGRTDFDASYYDQLPFVSNTFS